MQKILFSRSRKIVIASLYDATQSNTDAYIKLYKRQIVIQNVLYCYMTNVLEKKYEGNF